MKFLRFFLICFIGCSIFAMDDEKLSKHVGTLAQRAKTMEVEPLRIPKRQRRNPCSLRKILIAVPVLAAALTGIYQETASAPTPPEPPRSITYAEAAASVQNNLLCECWCDEQCNFEYQRMRGAMTRGWHPHMCQCRFQGRNLIQSSYNTSGE